MEPVRQCYTCFQYGHHKKTCRGDRKCIVCKEKFHGKCLKEPKCLNCGEKPRSNDKKCHVYEYNFQLKKIMAERNTSFYEAMNIVRPNTKIDLERQKMFLRIC